MQISLQEKIAELEARIAVLERDRKTVRRVTIETPASRFVESEWEKLWQQVDRVFASIFGEGKR